MKTTVEILVAVCAGLFLLLVGSTIAIVSLKFTQRKLTDELAEIKKKPDQTRDAIQKTCDAKEKEITKLKKELSDLHTLHPPNYRGLLFSDKKQ